MNSTHGKYKDAEQKRTQESKKNVAQESESRKAAEAAGIRPWLEEAQSEEDGARRGEAINGSAWPATGFAGQVLTHDFGSGENALWLKFRPPTIVRQRALLAPRTISFSAASLSIS